MAIAVKTNKPVVQMVTNVTLIEKTIAFLQMSISDFHLKDQKSKRSVRKLFFFRF